MRNAERGTGNEKAVTVREDTNTRLAGPTAVSRVGKSRFAIWLRYNWWKFFFHAALIYLGLTNLYPFFWMVGTSFKAEAEASSDRLSPFPRTKYKLSRTFDPAAVAPRAMEPDLARAKDAKETAALMARLGQKLAMLDKMQSDAQRENVSRCVGQALQETGDAAYAAARRLAGEKEKVLKEADAAWRAAEKEAGERGVRMRDWLKAQRDQAQAEVAAAQAARQAVVAERVRGLVAAGLLVESGGECWPAARLTDPARDAEWSEADRGLAPALRLYFAVTYKDLAKLTKTDGEYAARLLQSMADGGLAVEAGRSADGDNLYRLADGARGAVTSDGLRPRQILTLWSMAAENKRRSESRATYPLDSWSVRDYSHAHGVSDLAKAQEELEALEGLGHLRNATGQAINYWVVLKGENFLLHTLTTLLITAFCVVGTIYLSSMLGYALVRLHFPGKLLVLGVMIGSSILPGEARIIPIFKMLMSVGAMQNLWGMTLWLTSFGVGNALLMAGFFLTLPKEVDEAAQVDGAGVFRTFFDIALPMARPVVMTAALFAFLNAWNNFMIPLLCTLSRPSMQPLAVAVYTFQQGHPGKWQEINAAAAIMTVPVILLFLCVQKHVVKSIAVGAVKG
jgi:raffinose/stachyose/melibiose transport system permease protein